MKDDDLWYARRASHQQAGVVAMVPVVNSSTSVPLSVVIANRSGIDVLIAETGYFLDCTIRLTQEDGTGIQYTKRGQYNVGGEADNSRAIVRVSAGEMRSWECNLAESFTTLNAGRYNLFMECILYPSDAWGDKSAAISLIIRNLPVQIVGS